MGRNIARETAEKIHAVYWPSAKCHDCNFMDVAIPILEQAFGEAIESTASITVNVMSDPDIVRDIIRSYGENATRRYGLFSCGYGIDGERG